MSSLLSRSPLPSLESLDDCRVLVNAFYTQVRADPLLNPVFAARIPDQAWPAHLERMAGFWYTVLFGVPLFHGDPRAKHAPLPIEWQHYERWLSLWASTVDALFEGPRAEEAKARAARMARVLSASATTASAYPSSPRHCAGNEAT